MKKILFVLTLSFVLYLFLPFTSFAQGMMGYLNTSSDKSSIQIQQQEEQEGKKFLENLSQKTISCSQLSDADFEKIGEYFMGQSIGDTSRHIVMNEMMKRMMGQTGEEQMHIVMGKRFSGCDTTIAFPVQNVGFMSMMNMMAGRQQTLFGSDQWFGSMMNFGVTPFSGLGWPLLMFIWWFLVVIGAISVIGWLLAQTRGRRKMQ